MIFPMTFVWYAFLHLLKIDQMVVKVWIFIYRVLRQLQGRIWINEKNVLRSDYAVVQSSSLIGRAQQMDYSFSYVDSLKKTRFWINTRKWIIHLLISTNPRKAFNWCHLRTNINTIECIFLADSNKL